MKTAPTISARFAIAACLLAMAGSARAQNVGSYGRATKPPPPSPEVLANLNIPEESQKALLGKVLPIDGEWFDHDARSVSLRELVGGKPTILVPVYFNCPRLCGETIASMIETLRELRKLDPKLKAGDAFNLVFFSFDKKEFPQQARKRRELFHIEYDGRSPETEGVWFLSANKGQLAHMTDAADATIHTLTDAMKFPFVVPAEDKKGRELQHPTAILVLTPTGAVSSYNTEFALDARDLQKQLKFAADGQNGTTSARSALACFLGDDLTGYYRTAMRILGWTALPVLMAVAGIVAMARMKAKQESKIELPQ